MNRIVANLIYSAVAMTMTAAAAEIALVKTYGGATANTVAGYPQVFVAGPDFKTAAQVSVTADPNTNNGTTQYGNDAQRASNNTTAAVMAVVGKSPTPAGAQPATNGEPGAGQRIAFKENWNSAQGWATMRGNGSPFLEMQAFGKAKASGSAAWNAKVVMPSANGLYARFVLPSVVVNGVLEEDGPSTWQGRVRAEILVNGHSVWSSEGNRHNILFSPLNDNACSPNSQKSTVLTEFGVATGLTGTPATAAPQKTVTIGLGQFGAGDTVEVSLIVRADTQVDRKCCIKDINGVKESFCTGATTKVNWSDAMNPLTFHAGPVL